MDTTRFLAALTAGSLFFSAVPAFAQGPNAGIGAGAKFHFGLSQEESILDANGAVDVQATLLKRCEAMTDAEDAEDCRERVEARIAKIGSLGLGLGRHGRGKAFGRFFKEKRADVEITREALDLAIEKTEGMVKHGLTMLGKIASAFCASDKNTEGATCLPNIKASVSTRIQALINAAFSS